MKQLALAFDQKHMSNSAKEDLSSAIEANAVLRGLIKGWVEVIEVMVEGDDKAINGMQDDSRDEDQDPVKDMRGLMTLASNLGSAWARLQGIRPRPRDAHAD